MNQNIEQLLSFNLHELLALENADVEAIRYLKENSIDLQQKADSEELLMTLHNETKLLFPSYILRMKKKDCLDQASEEVLDVLLESGSRDAYEIIKSRNYGNLDKMSDEFLVLGIQSGKNSDIELKVLMDRYRRIVKRMIDSIDYRGFYFRGHETEDLIQEANIGLMKAIEVYKVERRTKFKDFSRYVIKRHLGTLMYRSNNKRNRALNDSISYNIPISAKNSTQTTTYEELMEGNSILPDELLIKKQLYYEIKEKLSEKEQEVLVPYSEGYSYEEIAFKIIEKHKLLDFKGLTYHEVFGFIKLIENISENYASITEYMSAQSTERRNINFDNLLKILEHYENRDNEHYLCGYSFADIKEVMKKRKKSVDNTIQRFKAKGEEHREYYLNRKPKMKIKKQKDEETTEVSMASVDVIKKQKKSIIKKEMVERF